MEFKELLDYYVKNMTKKVIAVSTEKAYFAQLSTMTRFFVENYGASTHNELTLENVRNYQRWRNDQISTTTSEKEMRVLKLMITAAHTLELIPVDFGPRIYFYKQQSSVKSQAYVDPEKLSHVFKQAKKYLDPYKYLVFYLGHVLMTRPGELLNIKKGDFNIQEQKLHIRGTKNYVSNSIIPISAKTIELVKPYLDKIEDDDRLFPRTIQWLGDVYKYLSIYCDVFDKDITPHKARKNMVMYHLAHGTNIKVLEKMGRWRNSRVLLEIYAKATPAQLMKAAEILEDDNE